MRKFPIDRLTAMELDLLINGQLVAGAGERIAVDNPATAEIEADVPSASSAQVEEAVGAASAAQMDWAARVQDERSATLRQIANRIDSDRDELARLLTMETGRPFVRNLVYVDFASAIFRQYAELARVHGGRMAPGNTPEQLSLIMRVPYGVVAALIPFNYPLDLLAFKVAPAIATGNTVVAKPAELTPLTTLRLASVLADELPPGVVNIVTGARDVGEALVEHPGVHLVAFTGSTAAGSAIGAACARAAKPAHLEMGGKDPAIVFQDSDIAAAAHGVVWAAFLNAGQVCTSTERAYVHESVYDEFLDHAAHLTSGLRVGDPMDEKTQIGPMRTNRGRQRVLDQLKEASGSGAKVLVGGNAPPLSGYFLNPTLVTGVDHSMSLMRDETFGPVLPVMPFSDDDEAFDLAGDTPYGLGASIYTNDPNKVQRAAAELQVGNLWVNDPVVDNPGAPFGGMRASGNARELGLEGMYAFTTHRHVHWNTDLQIKDWWYRVED